MKTGWFFFKELQYSTFIYSSQVCLRNKTVFGRSYSKLNIHKQAVSLLIKYPFTVTEIQQKLNKYSGFLERQNSSLLLILKVGFFKKN